MSPTNESSHVSFEEYLYYAEQTREEERKLPPVERKIKNFVLRKKGEHEETEKQPATAAVAGRDSSNSDGRNGSQEKGLFDSPSDEEWKTASRAARTATWGAVFYLITTDILGPYSVPWAMAQMGYGPGIALYAIFAVCAIFSGFLIWKIFLGMDSHKYPLKSYGDLFFRIFGKIPRYLANTLQSIQLLFNVGLIILSNGQGLSQVAKGKVCFSVLCLIWTIAGLLLGQIRTLQKYGWVANSAVWINIIVLCITMGVVTHTDPNYVAAESSNMQPKAPLLHTTGPPDYSDFPNQVVGLMQAVYSYGGAMIFCELMAEMRRPFDFWKGMICAQTLIFCLYIFFGVYVYAFQGQFAINPAIQGISPYGFQSAMNVLYMVASLIAAGLYGNIGIKVLYQNVFSEIFRAPNLNTRPGKLLWAGMVPVYWAIAFVIASAIPDFSALSAIVGAACIMQFTYTFPPLLMLGYLIKKDSILPGESFDPATGHNSRQDGGMRRLWRGVSKAWWIKLLYLLYFLGSATTAVLGIYSAVLGLISGYSGSSTSFGCASPVGA